MKILLQKSKKLFVGISCFLFALLLFSQSVCAEETQPPIATETLDKLTVTDEQGVSYEFKKTTTGYEEKVTVDFENVSIPDGGVANITIPSSITVRVPNETTEDEGTPEYEPKTLSISEVTISAKDTYPETISSLTFAEGITTLNSHGSILNTVQNVILPQSLNYLYGTICGKSKTDSNGLSYPTSEVPQWVEDLAAASADHIAYAGKTALWVSPDCEGNLIFKEGTEVILPFAAMGNENITSVVIPETVKNLGDGVFFRCKNLKSVTIKGTKLTEVPYLMVAESGMESFAVPEECNKICAYAFYGAEKLTKVTFTENSKCSVIDYRAFMGSALEEITIPATVENISSQAFRNATKLKKITFAENSVYEKVEFCTFKGCENLTSFTLPDSVEEIEGLAFMGCMKLKEFNISEKSSLQKINTGAFGWLFYEEEAEYVGSDDPYSGSEAYSLVDGEGSQQSLKAPSEYGCPIEEIFIPYAALTKKNIYGNYEGLPAGLFAGNTSLKKVVFQERPEGIKETAGYVPYKAFYGCTSLAEVQFNGNKMDVGTCAFSYCSNLKSVDLTGINKMEYASFASTGLTSITIPASVTVMGTKSLAYCKDLDKITIASTLASQSQGGQLFSVIGMNAGQQKDDINVNGSILAYTEEYQENGKIFSNADYKKAYPIATAPKVIEIQAVNGTSVFDALSGNCSGFLQYMVMTEEIILGDGIKTIGNKGCASCFSLKKITLPASLETIGDYAFFNDFQLTGIDFTKLTNLTTIGQQAFFLLTVDGTPMPNGIQSQEWQYVDLKDGYGLQEIILPKNVKEVGSAVFWGQRNVKKIVIKGENTTLERGSFQFCNNVEEIEIATAYFGNTYSSSWDNYFWNDRQKTLKKVTLSGKAAIYATTSQRDSFYGLQMKELVLNSENMTSVTKWLAQECTRLQKVELGEQVKTIEPGAFYLCENLKTITLPETVETLDIAAFAKSGLEEIVILNKDLTIKEAVGTVTDSAKETDCTKNLFSGANAMNAKAIPKGVTIYGYKDSTAETYAEKHGNKFVALDGGTLPEDTMSVENTVKTVGDVQGLPEGWTWKAESASENLIAGRSVTATAEYTGDYAQHYTTKEVEVAITRAACKAAEEILFTGKGEYAPTCTKEGLGHRECSLCGDVLEMNVKATATGHTMEHHNAREASCVKFGSSEYWTCKDCHKMFADAAGTKEIAITDLVVDKAKHEAAEAVVENQTDKTYDLVTYCKHCGCELSRETITITVDVTGIKLNKKQVTLGIGESFKVVTAITPSNATDKTLTYKSSKPSVATVDNGVIKAKKKGTAVITVTTANNKKATLKVTVKKAPKKVNLNVKKKNVKKGISFTLKAKLPKETASYKMTWKSSNKKVASVNANGKVTTLKKGKAKISVTTANGKKATCTVVVR